MPGEPRVHERVRTAELIAALCLATDLGMGFPFEHGLHTTLVAMRVAGKLGCFGPGPIQGARPSRARFKPRAGYRGWLVSSDLLSAPPARSPGCWQIKSALLLPCRASSPI